MAVISQAYSVNPVRGPGLAGVADDLCDRGCTSRAREHRRAFLAARAPASTASSSTCGAQAAASSSSTTTRDRRATPSPHALGGPRRLRADPGGALGACAGHRRQRGDQELGHRRAPTTHGGFARQVVDFLHDWPSWAQSVRSRASTWRPAGGARGRTLRLRRLAARAWRGTRGAPRGAVARARALNPHFTGVTRTLSPRPAARLELNVVDRQPARGRRRAMLGSASTR